MANVPGARRLPLAPLAAPHARRLPLASDASAADRFWRPVYAVWEITLKCDLACRHCGSRAGRARPDELSTAQALDLVQQMADLGVKEVTLIGGEAYLRDDWTTIARAVRDRGMSCSITTGGRGLTAERARAAREAGITQASVSVDGLRETHDAMRAMPGAFDAAMQAMANLRDAGIRVLSNTHIHRRNLPELERIYSLLEDQRVHTWMVMLTVAMGRAADEPDILLEPYQVLDVIPRIARLKARAEEDNRALRGARAPHDGGRTRVMPGNNIGYFGPFDSILHSHMPDRHAGSCGAGRLVLGIEANGDVKGCPSLPSNDYVGGNVRDHSLQDIWERGAPLRFTRERTAASLSGFCRTCYYAEECLGGCSWTTHVLSGQPGDNPFCHHRALELMRQGKRERLERRQVAGGQPFDFGRFAIVEEPWPEDERARYQRLQADA